EAGRGAKTASPSRLDNGGGLGREIRTHSAPKMGAEVHVADYGLSDLRFADRTSWILFSLLAACVIAAASSAVAAASTAEAAGSAGTVGAARAARAGEDLLAGAYGAEV